MTAVQKLAEWNACRDMLLPALHDATEDELINDLLTNHAQLWRGERSAMVTRLHGMADEPYVMVWLGGGDLSNLLDVQPVVESWARQQGAKAARINGRKGWARALRDRGFSESDGELRKAL